MALPAKREFIACVVTGVRLCWRGFVALYRVKMSEVETYDQPKLLGYRHFPGAAGQD
jgi:hypothetical protein